MRYDPPMNAEQIAANYGYEVADRLLKDPTHKWRAKSGIELIHEEPTKQELERIWKNWNLMPDELKKKSDRKSIQLFGVDNATHYKQLK